MIKPILFVLLVKGATLAMCEQSREDVNSQNCFLSDVTDSNIWSKCKHLKLHLVCLCMFGNSCCKALSDRKHYIALSKHRSFTALFNVFFN